MGQEKRIRGDIIRKLEDGEELTAEEAALHGDLVSNVEPTLRETALAVAQTAFKNLRDGAATPEETEQMVREIIKTVTGND
ncbi:hypothetical protein [Octadecabacter ascidiaceicola]|uniref:Uncharacterized protein n=1 Tax=Octadecabacter ascidiaceicola TaxID=1655543 RepID=A0A238KS06_9RHOB|nr:hypothetical protein [Octadecabacter ascidiaceicola]SMX45595.1 hypothetical protein OCA8868_03334 [Octadecabacter ascidiaceicola]